MQDAGLPLAKLTDFEEFEDDSGMFDDFRPSEAPSPYASPISVDKGKLESSNAGKMAHVNILLWQKISTSNHPSFVHPRKVRANRELAMCHLAT